jgi:hypothetical protein
MPTETAANVTTIEDATAARWLAKTLAPARADVAAGPSAEAVDRIRARVFGEAAPRRAARKIAA